LKKLNQAKVLSIRRVFQQNKLQAVVRGFVKEQFEKLPKGSNADKAPFLVWIIVEVATRLSSTLCANSRHLCGVLLFIN
jgi:hypothetical protein